MNFSQSQLFQTQLTQSVNFNPGSFSTTLLSSRTNSTPAHHHEDEMFAQKKVLRQKEADFMKEKAILVQQVELLKMQLGESQERESNLKKMNENIMSALQNSSDNQVKAFELEVNEDHPRVADLIRQTKQEFLQNQLLEKERHRETEYALEKENQQLNYKVMDLSKKAEIFCKETELQKQEYQQLLRRYTDEVKSGQEKLKQDYEGTIKRLQNELQIINTDIERQVITRLNEKYLNDQAFNESIIKYQKEQQTFLDEQREFRKKLETLESQNTMLQDRLRKTDDENGSIKYKMKQLEKKLKEENEGLRKQREEACKKVEVLEQQKKNTITSKKPGDKVASNTISGPQKSRNSQNSLNKENLMGNKSVPNSNTLNEEDEEKNKLRRQISMLRCQLKKLEIDIKDLKMKSNQEVASLRDKLNVERKKRMNLYEEKIDKNNQLLQDLLEKDQTIFALQRQVTKLQEKLSLFGFSNHRSQTPNHNQLGMSVLQDSIIVNNVLTQSLADLNLRQFNHQAGNSSKRLISPLRSLDLTLANNNLNSVSFSLLPLSKDHRGVRQSSQKKDSLGGASPKQIKKRNRIHSVQITSSTAANPLGKNILLSSLNGGKRLRQRSRDGSIQEVNEEHYLDSVESRSSRNDNEVNYEDAPTHLDGRIENQNIMLKFGGLGKNEVKKTYFTTQGTQDDELRQVLDLREEETEKANRQLRLSNNGVQELIYFDSLENQSISSVTENEEVAKLYKQFQKQQSQKNFEISVIKPETENAPILGSPRVAIQLKQVEEKPRRKLKRQVMQEDEDCLVNILEMQDDNHIEVQPLITSSRQHMSTENLFGGRDTATQQTIDSLNSFRMQKQQQLLKQQHRKTGSGVVNKVAAPIPKPTQKAAVQHIQPQPQQIQKSRIGSRRNSMSKPSESKGDYQQQILKSPSSPNILKQNSINLNDSETSSTHMRIDSCPSPLDEDETIVELGSGEKLRLKNPTIEQCQKQMQNFVHKFAMPPSAKNQPMLQQQTSANLAHGRNQQPMGFGFRTRTNSLINSCCSEISVKMKFIRDMPQQNNGMPEQQMQVDIAPQRPTKHMRVPSLQGGLGLQKALSYHKHK